MADSFKTGMCQWSRKKRSFDLYPSHYRAGEEAFVTKIKEICAERRIDLIFPSHNETEILARHKDQFPGLLGALLPDSDHCAMFNNKALSYTHAMNAGVSVPLRIDYENPSEIAEKIASAGVERTVIKLLTGNSSKGVFYAQTGLEAQSLVQQLVVDYALPPDRLPQIEEYVEGEGWGSSVLYWHGEKIAGFSHKRLREKVATGGTSTLREAVIAKDLEQAAEKIFSTIGWHGLAMSEFKRCPKTGKFWFIEVNPRLWGSLPLAVNAGAEFPYLAWLCATKGPEAARAYAAQGEVEAGWRNRWLLGDLLVATKDLVRGRVGSAAGTLFSARANGTDDVFWDDPLVFPGELARYTASAVSHGNINAAEKGMVG